MDENPSTAEYRFDRFPSILTYINYMLSVASILSATVLAQGPADADALVYSDGVLILPECSNARFAVA